MPRPFMRSNSTTWYVKLDGKQIPLGKDVRFKTPPKAKPKEPPPEILKKYHALMQMKGEPEDRTLSFCVARYLESLEECTAKTKYRAKHFLEIFETAVGDIKASKLKGHHIDDAMKGRDWKPNTRHAFITRVEACLNHCVRKGWIPKNPVKGVIEKPTPERREEIMAAADRKRVLEAADECFGAVLRFLAGTGCRPIEARLARVEKCDLGKSVVLVPNKTRKKTGVQERPVFLSSEMTNLCRELIGDRKEGWLLLNSFGNPWKQTALEHRLEKLCGKLGITRGAQLYSFRHNFISDAINRRNMNPALLAIQCGHSDLKMLMKHYLHADSEAMKKALDER